ncbi:hypothetical protein [Halorussus halophilus]|uniref:hypothetical protein n=1 Tax=Halorussus halophilus TaxID=2650975 RepID=UPI0013014376|nr:hypothetical protein [Halorussus halophilus]
MTTADTESIAGGESVSGTPDYFDVLRYNGDVYRAVPAGDGDPIVAAHETEARQRRLLGSLTVAILPPITAVVFGFWYSLDVKLLGGVGLLIGVIAGVARYLYQDHEHRIPEVVAAGVSTRIVNDYIDDFDPEEVPSPFA